MDLLDGFIVGIYNYCDRWCETCPFTARCRVFATTAELHASDDPLFVTLGAGLLRSAGALDASLTATALSGIEDDEDDDDDVLEMESMFALPEEERAVVVPPAHEALKARAMAYGEGVWRWLGAHPREERALSPDPYAVVSWFHFMLGAKIDRALHGLRDVAAGDAESLPDAEGSAKVALLGAERSHAAWLDLVAGGEVSVAEAEPFITDLAWIIEQLDTLIPSARAFVRPAFDEPDAVARLVAEGG